MTAQQLALFDASNKAKHISVTNVASIPQRSPFRYPGGKTWLIPIVRNWLTQTRKNVPELIEPFAGGGIVSLTAAFEKLAKQITMVEIDEEVAAVWEVILKGDNKWLAEKIYSFELNLENIDTELNNPVKEIRDVAFCTILKNRILHGGILAKGAGRVKSGENGKGLASRWYPKTLRDRILAINHIKDSINFINGDAFEVIEKNIDNREAYMFIDPPYVFAGKRLYTHFDIDHERLFSLAAQLTGKFMLTYDDTPEICRLAEKYELNFKRIPMKTTHHLQKNEIIISDNFSWWKMR